ncbi:MAG: signal peptide peptidase SppA [Lachnospiraceae bacterium]
MKKKQIIAMIIAAVLFVFIGASNVFVRIVEQREQSELGEETAQLWDWTEVLGLGDSEIDYESSFPDERFAAVIPVTGTIMSASSASETGGYDHEAILSYIDALTKQPNNEAIVLYMNTPGGAVIDADELYLKLMDYKEITGRPVYAYVHSYNFSGGYYVAMAADKIISNRNAMIGSIGVIVSTYDVSGLYEKLGIEEINITSGKNKAMFTGDEEATQEQIQMYQDIVNDAYDQFLNIVCEGRSMTADQLQPVADGSVFSAAKAAQLGLIDEVADTYEDAMQAIGDELQVYTFAEMPVEEESLFERLFSKLEALTPKSESEVLEELTTTVKSKGLMYYAEP